MEAEDCADCEDEDGPLAAAVARGCVGCFGFGCDWELLAMGRFGLGVGMHGCGSRCWPLGLKGLTESIKGLEAARQAGLVPKGILVEAFTVEAVHCVEIVERTVRAGGWSRDKPMRPSSTIADPHH